MNIIKIFFDIFWHTLYVNGVFSSWLLVLPFVLYHLDTLNLCTQTTCHLFMKRSYEKSQRKLHFSRTIRITQMYKTFREFVCHISADMSQKKGNRNENRIKQKRIEASMCMYVRVYMETKWKRIFIC